MDYDNREYNNAEVPELKERKRWLFLGLPFSFTSYILTKKSLKLKRGFFTTYEDDILLFRVVDVSIKRTLFQKLFGLGTLTVSSSDKSHPTLVMKNVKHVHSFKSELDERVENERLRMRFRAGEYIDADIDDDDDHHN